MKKQMLDRRKYVINANYSPQFQDKSKGEYLEILRSIDP